MNEVSLKCDVINGRPPITRAIIGILREWISLEDWRGPKVSPEDPEADTDSTKALGIVQQVQVIWNRKNLFTIVKLYIEIVASICIQFQSLMSRFLALILTMLAWTFLEEWYLQKILTVSEINHSFLPFISFEYLSFLFMQIKINSWQFLGQIQRIN